MMRVTPCDEPPVVGDAAALEAEHAGAARGQLGDRGAAHAADAGDDDVVLACSALSPGLSGQVDPGPARAGPRYRSRGGRSGLGRRERRADVLAARVPEEQAGDERRGQSVGDAARGDPHEHRVHEAEDGHDHREDEGPRPHRPERPADGQVDDADDEGHEADPADARALEALAEDAAEEQLEAHDQPDARAMAMASAPRTSTPKGRLGMSRRASLLLAGDPAPRACVRTGRP